MGFFGIGNSNPQDDSPRVDAGEAGENKGQKNVDEIQRNPGMGDQGDQGASNIQGEAKADDAQYTHVLKEVQLQQTAPGEDTRVQPETQLTQAEAAEIETILVKQHEGNWDVKHFEVVRDGKVVTLSLVDYRDGERLPATLEALDGE